MGFKKDIFSNQGMSLIEVMVAVTVMSMVGLGTASLLKGVIDVQKRVDTKGNLQVIVQNMKATILDDNAWSNTVNQYALGHAKGIDCLRDDVNATNYCAESETPSNFNLRDPSNNYFFRAAQATRGFNLAGQNCNSYSGTDGNDDCPFRYDLTATFDCDSGATCQKPKVTINATFRVNPASKGDPRFNINTNSFSFSIDRGDMIKFQPLQVRHYQTNDDQGGRCNTAGGWRRRRLNDTSYDVGGNVVSLGSNIATLKAGTYSCTITAQAYHQPLGFKVRLISIGGGIEEFVGSGLTQPYTSTTITGHANFSISSDTGFHIEHYCPVNPGGADPNRFQDAPARSYHMGLPLPSYGEGSSFTKMDCVRSS